MILSLVCFVFLTDPKMESYDVPPHTNLTLSMESGSLAFINSQLFTSNDFVFYIEKDDYIIKPEVNRHIIFEKENVTIIPTSKNILIDKNLSLLLWRISDGLCDSNAYVVSSDYQMSLVPRSTSFSKFCIFSMTNYTDYVISIHTSKYCDQENIELFVDEASGGSQMKNDAYISVQRPFMIVGKHENVNIGKIIMRFHSSDNNCSVFPVLKYNLVNSNSSLKKLLKEWTRVDIKCIVKGNDADAGFISLVVILVLSVLFVLVNAKKFVTVGMDGFAEIPQPVTNNLDRLEINEDDISQEENSDNANNQIGNENLQNGNESSMIENSHFETSNMCDFTEENMDKMMNRDHHVL